MRSVTSQLRSLSSSQLTRLICSRTAHACGDGSQGALGLGEDETVAYELEANGLQGSNLQCIAGHFHSLFLKDNGEVWACGRNKENQVGPGHQAAVFRPQRVDIPIEARQLAASGVVSGACGEDGSLWLWGRSRFGQLGQPGEGPIHRDAPTRVEGITGAQQLALGWGHAALITCQGFTSRNELLTWGYPKHGRLGHHFGDTKDADAEDEATILGRCVSEPEVCEMPIGATPAKVVCGLDHTVVACADGRVVSFGDNSLGQLGRHVQSYADSAQDENDWVVRDRMGSELKAVDVACGLAHSMAITFDDEVVTWGWNGGGQLGWEPSKTMDAWAARPVTFQGHSADDGWIPISISAGRAHSSATLRRDSDEGQARHKVFVWGSGVSGRLGTGSQEDALRPVEVSSSADVYNVSLGFDHTILVV